MKEMSPLIMFLTLIIPIVIGMILVYTSNTKEYEDVLRLQWYSFATAVLVLGSDAIFNWIPTEYNIELGFLVLLGTILILGWSKVNIRLGLKD